MNKIVIVDDIIEESNIQDIIKLKVEKFSGIFAITNIDIEIIGNTKLELDIKETEKKAKVKITIKDNCCANIYIYEKNNDSKLQYNFVLGKSSKLVIRKLKYGLGGKEMFETTLDKEDSCFEYNLKSICRKKEVCDCYIYHKAPYTFSNITNDILTLEKGNIQLQMSFFVPNSKREIKIDNNNRVFNLNNKKSDVRPNFYIDQFDTEIKSSTYVGLPKEESIFDIFLKGIENNNIKMEIIKILEEGGELYQ